MGIFSKVTGFFGFRNPRDGGGDDDDDDDDQGDHDRRHQPVGGDGSDDRDENFRETGVPRRGFSVQVAVERPGLGPVVEPCNSGDGGIQGLRWCARRLRMDEDGDVAHEFLDAVVLSASSLSPSLAFSEETEKSPLPRLQVHHRTRPAMVKNQAMDVDGKLQYYVEHQGRLQWA